MVMHHVGLAAIDEGARSAQPQVVQLVRRNRSIDQQLVSPTEGDDFNFRKQRHRDWGTLA
jgi:hypothetical protein